MARSKKIEPKIVEIPSIKLENIELKVVGTSPLIMNAWSMKARMEIEDKQQQKAKAGKKAPKDPKSLYRNACYWLDRHGNRLLPVPDIDPSKHKAGFAVPGGALKAGAVEAGRNTEMKMTLVRGALHIKEDWIKIWLPGFKKLATPIMRTDMVRISGTCDVRYRPEFPEWALKFSVIFNVGVISAEQVINLFNVSGFACGLHEWRPGSKHGGNHGMFQVV
jgi:hypothetical protein